MTYQINVSFFLIFLAVSITAKYIPDVPKGKRIFSKRIMTIFVKKLSSYEWYYDESEIEGYLLELYMKEV